MSANCKWGGVGGWGGGVTLCPQQNRCFYLYQFGKESLSGWTPTRGGGDETPDWTIKKKRKIFYDLKKNYNNFMKHQKNCLLCAVLGYIDQSKKVISIWKIVFSNFGWKLFQLFLSILDHFQAIKKYWNARNVTTKL